MTPIKNAAILAAALAASAPAFAFNDCVPGQCGPTPGGPNNTTITATAAPTGVAASRATAGATAAVSQRIEGVQRLTGQQNFDGSLAIDGRQIQAQGKQSQTQGSVTADSKAVGGNQTIVGDTTIYKAAKIPVASAIAGTAYAEGICGHAGSGAAQGTMFGLSFNFSGKEQHCRNYFMLLANNQPEAATVYGMQNIPGMAQAISGAADVEEAVAAKPGLGETAYIKFRGVKVQPLVNQ